MLMRDANNRQKSNSRSSPSGENTVLNPANYTIPASALNTFTVDFALSPTTCSRTHSQSDSRVRPKIPFDLEKEQKALKNSWSGEESRDIPFSCNRSQPKPNGPTNNIPLPTNQNSSNVLASIMSTFNSQLSNHHNFTKVNSSVTGVSFFKNDVFFPLVIALLFFRFKFSQKSID